MRLERPIIFIGVARAGTSVISEIILQHDDLAVISSYHDKFPNSTLVNFIRPVVDNKLWRINGQKKQLNKVSFGNRYSFKSTEAYNFWENLSGKELNFSRGFLIDQKAGLEEQEKIRNFISKLIKFQRKKRIGFKLTGPSRIAYLNSIFPDALFVEIVREPLANIRSLLKVHFWKEKGMNQLWWTGAYSEAEIEMAEQLKDKPELLTAIQYRKIRDITNEEVRKYGVKHLQIKYEDFVEDPRREIDKILSFTGLSQNPKIDNYLKINKIYNQNSAINNFFNEQQQSELKEILKDYINY